MTTIERREFLTPCGRLVSGNVAKGRTTDEKGQPLTVGSGPNKGQLRTEYSFGLAIAKTPGVTHWANEPWAAAIWQAGHDGTAQAGQMRDFSWKVVDGDSQEVNKKGKRNCDREGYPGNWVLYYSSGMAPRMVQSDGRGGWLDIPTDPGIPNGFYVEVKGNAKHNGNGIGTNTNTPGVYLQATTVCLRFAGAVIESGFEEDPSAIGFGASAMPAGAQSLPAMGAGAAPLPPTAPGAPPAAPTTAAPAPSAPPPAPTPVTQQSTAYMAPPPPTSGAAPAAPPPPPAAPAAPAAPVKQMTDKAQGTYEWYISGGWDDAALIANGYMIP